MGGGGGGGENGEPEFQIAPMIDVLLVLLIFFMSITSVEVLQIDKDIKLPVAEDAKKKDKNAAMFEGAINVGWVAAKQEARITFEDRDYQQNTEELVNILSQRKDKNPKYRCIIRGDRQLPAIEIQKVMTIITQAGIDDISFSAMNQE
jgi:biopolymer transport protein ExbD